MNFFHLSLSRSRNLAFVFVNSLLPQTLGQLGKPTALGTPLNILWLLKATGFSREKVTLYRRSSRLWETARQSRHLRPPQPGPECKQRVACREAERLCLSRRGGTSSAVASVESLPESLLCQFILWLIFIRLK